VAGQLEEQLVLLSTIRDEVERTGLVSPTSQEALDKSFGKQASSLATTCYELSCMARRQQSADERDRPDSEREKLLKLLHPNDAGDAEKVSADKCKEVLLRAIDVSMQTLRELHEAIEKTEKRVGIATLRSHNLPSREYVDKLVRHEGAQERRKREAIKLAVSTSSTPERPGELICKNKANKFFLFCARVGIGLD